ncbi:Mitochondrial import inner membrane translocase subunit TIM14-2 [Bienertia sinuspersici]
MREIETLREKDRPENSEARDLQKMTRREAALILGIREREAAEKIKEAHRRVMIANHPDAGGSHYLASKINEAKDKLIDKPGNNDSVF